MGDIFENADQEWKRDRVLYQLSNDFKQRKYQEFLNKYIPNLNYYVKELENSGVWKNLNKKRLDSDWVINSRKGMMALYSTIRVFKPNILLETGVASGASTTVFLQALKLNNYGKLISIDDCSEHPELFAIFVPEELKERWQFIKGRSCDILPTIKEPVDIFHHDSLHTYDNMMYEYQWAWENLRDGGLLMSHDVGMNNAFFDFVHNYNVDYYLLNSYSPAGYGTGVIVKNDNKLIDKPIQRKRLKSKPKPKIEEFSRSNFQYGLDFVDRMRKQFKELDVVEYEGRGGINEPIIVIGGKKVAQISPRNGALYGGYFQGKPFRIINKEEEKQLENLIEKILSKTFLDVEDFF